MRTNTFEKRVSALLDRISNSPEGGCDTVWIIQPENRRYLSGFRAEDAQFTESSGSLLINAFKSILVTDSRYTSEAESEAVHFEVKTLAGGLVKEFPDLLKGMGTKSLGFEEGYLTCALHRQLRERFEEVSLPVGMTPLDGVVEDMREVKDDQEIRALEASADLMSRILDEVIDGLEPGVREKEVAWRIEDLARQGGADCLAFPSIVASGPNSALPHAVPTDRRIGKGEPVILDVGVRLEGYCSDMTRTVFLGDPAPEFRKIYRTVRKAQLAALEAVRPGVDTDRPDALAREVIGEAGFGDYFGHALGHGVGLATHEGPRLSPLKPSILRKGAVVTVEPGIYMPGKGGVRLEETVAVEEQGARIITSADHLYDF